MRDGKKSQFSYWLNTFLAAFVESLGIRLQLTVFFFTKVVAGKFYDAVLALARSLHLMILDGYDISGQSLGFDFDSGPIKPWRYGEELMKYIRKVKLKSGIVNCFLVFANKYVTALFLCVVRSTQVVQ